MRLPLYDSRKACHLQVETSNACVKSILDITFYFRDGCNQIVSLIVSDDEHFHYNDNRSWNLSKHTFEIYHIIYDA